MLWLLLLFIFRNATHSYVIRLLKGSGTHPALLVSAHPPGHGRAGRRGSSTSSRSDAMKRHSAAFKEKVYISIEEHYHNIETFMCAIV